MTKTEANLARKGKTNKKKKRAKLWFFLFSKKFQRKMHFTYI